MMKVIWVWLWVCAAMPGPWRGAHQASPSSCDLLHPGLLWLRSIFCYQSSFFGRHLDQDPIGVNQTPQMLREMWWISWRRIFVVENCKNSGSFGHVESQASERGGDLHMTDKNWKRYGSSEWWGTTAVGGRNYRHKISWDSTQIKLYQRLASHPARLICCNLLSEISR